MWAILTRKLYSSEVSIGNGLATSAARGYLELGGGFFALVVQVPMAIRFYNEVGNLIESAAELRKSRQCKVSLGEERQ